MALNLEPIAASNLFSTFSLLSLNRYIMITLPPKYTLVTLLVATTTIHGYPLPPLHTEPVVERGFFDSVDNLIDKTKSGVGSAVNLVGGLVGIGSDDSNHTPTLPVAKGVFAELTKGALYSNVAYCSAGSVKGLSCGATCEALGGIEVAFTGGDNKEVPACKWEYRLFKITITFTHTFSNKFSLRLTRRFKALWSLLRALSRFHFRRFSQILIFYKAH